MAGRAPPFDVDSLSSVRAGDRVDQAHVENVYPVDVPAHFP